MQGLLTSSATSEMLSISLVAEIIRGNRVAINISPLCGDDSVHILQRTNRRTFDEKPGSVTCDDKIISFANATVLVHRPCCKNQRNRNHAALPQHIAVSLWLTGDCHWLFQGYASIYRGAASALAGHSLRKGKAFPLCAAA